MNRFSYTWCFDNSGIKILKLLNGFKNEKIRVNSKVNLVAHKIYPHKKKRHKKEVYVKKRKNYGGKVIAAKMRTGRFDGSYLKMSLTKCIVFDKERGKFLGSKIYGSAQKELKKNDTTMRRVISYSCKLI